MLPVVENIRKKQLAWVHAIMRHKGVKRSRMAKDANVNHSTILKFMSDPLDVALLHTSTVEKLERYSGIPPYETGPVEPPQGFEEKESEPYAPTEESHLARAIQAIKAGRNGIDPWVLNSRALENAGYFPGDILIIDLNETPESGDIVCAQVYDRLGRAETVMRIYEEPYLIAATGDRTLMRPALVDNDRVKIRGVMLARISDRRAA